MKLRAARTPLFVASRLLLLLLSLCLLLSACAHPPIQFPPSATDPTKDMPGNDTQYPTPSKDITPASKEYVNRVGNLRAICLNDRYQDKSCQSVVLDVSTLSYQSHDPLRTYFSQPDNQLIGVRVLGRDIKPTADKNGTLVYCLDMQALGVDVTGYGYGWEDLWVQFFFSPGSLKENQAYPMMVETHYEGDFYKKEEQHVFGNRGVLEYAHNRVSSARVYASLSQLYEQTDVKDLHLPASAACMQIECRDSGNWLQYDLADNEGTIFIQQEPEGELKKEMDRYKDFYSKRVIHEKGGMTYYIIGSWATCGAPAVPTSYSIYWQIGTRYYHWFVYDIDSFEEAIALVEDLQTFSKS